MADELLDIVDENNVPTGKTAFRSKVHIEGFWHRTVHVYLFRRKNGKIEFLLHLRSPFKDLKPNTWDTRFGGHIKAGMDMQEAVKAELKEEIGLKLEEKDLIEGPWRKSDNMPNREFPKVYFFEYDNDLKNLRFNDGEVQEVRWMDMEEIKKSLSKDPQKYSGSLKGFMEVSNYLASKINLC